MGRRIGILTGGGDAPGLNAVIRAFVKRATGFGFEVVGVEESFNGLLETPRGLCRLDGAEARGLLHRGGTVLGTTNNGDPFAWPRPMGPEDRSAELAAAIEAEGIEGLVVLGGDGTMKIALRLMHERGVKIIGVPKTIDNDLSATDVTFGFQTAVDIASEALDRLHTTGESHRRVMLLEVMGRDVGHIALSAGIAGGADVILIPEIPYDPEQVAASIRARYARGRRFAIVVVAEGALPASDAALSPERRKKRLRAAGGAANIAMAQLEGRLPHEMRVSVLGHVQRGGSPTASDRILATRFGAHAAQLVSEQRWGEIVVLQRGLITSVPIADAAVTRAVDIDGELTRTARAVGVEFGG